MAVNQMAATTGAVVRNFFIGSAGGNGHFAVIFQQLSTGELTEGGKGPGG